MVKVTVLAPAYNEADVIESFVDTVMFCLSDLPCFELLIVNDGSTDQTGNILKVLQEKYHRLRVITHDTNKGLGAGLATGFKNATGEVIVTLDADLSQPPELIHILLRKIRLGADVVIASRYVSGGYMVDVPYWRQAISQLGNWLIRNRTGLPVHDCTSGMRAYKAEYVKDLKNIGTGFDVQLRILKKLNKCCRFAEVPLRLENRAAGKSKMSYVKLIPQYLQLLKER